MKRLHQFCDLDDERGDWPRTLTILGLFLIVMTAALMGWMT